MCSVPINIPEFRTWNFTGSETSLLVAGIPVTPVRVMHGKPPIFGYRIGNMAYLTDVKYLPEEEYAKLEGLDVLILTALRRGAHHA